MITQETNEFSVRARTDLYLQLASAAAKEQQPAAETRFLLLAGYWGLQADLPTVVDNCRQRLLTLSPDHALHRFQTLAAALEHPEFATYVRELGEAYAIPKAAYLLERYRAAGYDGEHSYVDQLGPDRWPHTPLKRLKKRRRPKAPRRTEPPVETDSPEPMVPEEVSHEPVEPLPFEWPAAERPLWPRMHPAWAWLIGLIMGMTIGLWLAPRLATWFAPALSAVRSAPP